MESKTKTNAQEIKIAKEDLRKKENEINKQKKPLHSFTMKEKWKILKLADENSLHLAEDKLGIEMKNIRRWRLPKGALIESNDKKKKNIA